MTTYDPAATPEDRSLGIALRWAVWLSHHQPVPTSLFVEKVRQTVKQIILESPDRWDGDIEIALRIWSARAAKHDMALTTDDLGDIPFLVSAYRDAGPNDLRWLYGALDLIANFEKAGA